METKPYHERITDSKFRNAVDLLDAGDAVGLERYLVQHPELVYQRIWFNEEGYFKNPGLLEFVAENPVRHDRLPKNIVEVARVILEAGAKNNAVQIAYTLGLVCSGHVAREYKVQIPLINLLCAYGADPNGGMLPALAHAEFEVVEVLIARGVVVDLPTASATGRTDRAAKLIRLSDNRQKHLALAFAAQHGHPEILKLLLDAGQNPNLYNPEGAHMFSTPLHQAILSGHEKNVRMLVEAGARMDLKDTIYHGNALDWAMHVENIAIADYLRSQGAEPGGQ
ncbi:ankyrin repeat domain-containing protein [Dyadobacter sp. LHD-138]|uniref:ankyrin repeat domain-containing protein n=1 Tax=Dyadobacter sp. LHD-138 TaxID=3071413 RepID=UPI0027DEEEBB|nr:ankyrin repeat domain-containing protein [Dyadobacter sp. LHD-138]MDQ6481382.1 ankyrin repeat domain-containing protein [Dyadobacter sp. LHD-138]